MVELWGRGWGGSGRGWVEISLVIIRAAILAGTTGCEW